MTLRNFTVLACILSSGCGARSSVDSALDGAPPRDGGRDASLLDGRDGPDGSGDAADTTTPDTAPRGCELGQSTLVLSLPSQLHYPALARVGNDVMVAFTRYLEPDPPEVWVLPLTVEGEPRGEPQRVGPGRGGTLVPVTLGDQEPGFSLSYLGPENAIKGARMGLDAEAIATAPLGRISQTFRPLLVLTDKLAVNGWNEDGLEQTKGFVQWLPSPEVFDFQLPGTDPVGATDESDSFRVATRALTHAYVHTIDSRGVTLDQRIIEPVAPFDDPVFVTGARVVDRFPSASVIWGTVQQQMEQMYLRLDLPSETFMVATEGKRIDDVDADYADGWLAGCAGVSHYDPVPERGFTPSVFFYGLHETGAQVTLDVAGPLPTQIPGPFPAEQRTRPAILWTGQGATFLVVWTTMDVVNNQERMEAARVRCF